MKVYVVSKIDYLNGTFGVTCVYLDKVECVKFLKMCGWKETGTTDMYIHNELHSHVIIHEKTLIEAGPNQHLLPNDWLDKVRAN